MNALTDGLFAIVLTLLILEIGIPEPLEPDARLVDELVENLPDLIAWVVSFLVLARIWVVHHTVTANMSRCHLRTLMLNFLLLGLVSLTPFTASLIAAHPSTSSLVRAFEFQLDGATAVFALQLGLVGLALGLFVAHVAKEPDVQIDDAEDLTWHTRHHLWVLPTVAVVAAGLSELHHPLWAFAILTVEFAVALLILARHAQQGHPETGEKVPREEPADRRNVAG
jgi:uncharacterized membrane protein